jgi:hypothetical protein
MEILLAVIAGSLALVASWAPCVTDSPGTRFPVPGKRLTKTGWIISSAIVALTSINSFVAYRSGEATDRFRAQSERIVFEQYVEIFRGQVWQAPVSIRSGAILELRGFDDEMLIEYGPNETKLPSSIEKAQQAKIGASFIGEQPGETIYQLKILTASGEKHVGGWVTVRSTFGLRP